MNARYSPAMLTDLYEMTMANGYFLTPEAASRRAAFDIFYRRNPDGGGFAVFAGLEQMVEYLTSLRFSKEDVDYLSSLNLYDEGFLSALGDFRFTGDMYAFPEGTIMYPGEPVATVIGTALEAQLVETALLNQFNHQSLIATKARRVAHAAKGRQVADFGARRAHGGDAAVFGARAAMIGGVSATATVAAGQAFSLPVTGTMAHSWVMMFESELESFRRFAALYPDNCILLCDTYDVLSSGVPNSILVFSEMKKRGTASKSYGIRIDSGDLAYLSKRAREMLDAAGFTDAKIVVSNSLDEYTVGALLSQGSPIDAFGVGERLITARSEPVFGGVYKLCAVEKGGVWTPRIKISDTMEKTTTPGLKDVYRVYNGDGRAFADLIALRGETLDPARPLRVIDPEKPWKTIRLEGCTLRPLREKVVENGRRVRAPESVKIIASRVKHQLAREIWEEEQRLDNPHLHYIDMTPACYELKMSMMAEEKEANP